MQAPIKKDDYDDEEADSHPKYVWTDKKYNHNRNRGRWIGIAKSDAAEGKKHASSYKYNNWYKRAHNDATGLKEDVPTNNVGSGEIAGVGTTNPSKPSTWAEPGVTKKRHKLMLLKMFKRRLKSNGD